MDNKDIIYDELKRNEVDIDKQTLSFHIHSILHQNREFYYAINTDSLNFEQTYKEINVANYGHIFAYLAIVSLQNDSAEVIRQNVRRCVDAFRRIDIPRKSKQPMLIILPLVLVALYVIL